MSEVICRRGFDLPAQCVLLDTAYRGVRVESDGRGFEATGVRFVEPKPWGGVRVQGGGQAIYFDGAIIRKGLPPGVEVKP